MFIEYDDYLISLSKIGYITFYEDDLGLRVMQIVDKNNDIMLELHVKDEDDYKLIVAKLLANRRVRFIEIGDYVINADIIYYLKPIDSEYGFCIGVWNHEKEIITIEASYNYYVVILRKLQVI
jgi:hypothetical protein